MQDRSIAVVVVLAAALLGGMGIGSLSAQVKQERQGNKETSSLDESAELAEQYLDDFKKTGVPTPGAVDSAFQTAATAGTIESWIKAASMANSYANVVGVLDDHYSDLYYASKTGGYNVPSNWLSAAVDYGKMRNSYLKRRNDAYIELAKLYLATGDKAAALGYLVTAIKLSGERPNTDAENLIRQIIEYVE